MTTKKPVISACREKTPTKTICVGAHMDTLGLMVRRIDEMIRTRNLGGMVLTISKEAFGGHQDHTRSGLMVPAKLTSDIYSTSTMTRMKIMILI